MRPLRLILLAGVLFAAGCAADAPAPVPAGSAARVAEANSFAAKADAAATVCTESGLRAGTSSHAACMRSLMRTEGDRVRSRAARLAERAARLNYTCFDQAHMRLVRCYDI